MSFKFRQLTILTWKVEKYKWHNVPTMFFFRREKKRAKKCKGNVEVNYKNVDCARIQYFKKLPFSTQFTLALLHETTFWCNLKDVKFLFSFSMTHIHPINLHMSNCVCVCLFLDNLLKFNLSLLYLHILWTYVQTCILMLVVDVEKKKKVMFF